MNRSVVHRLLSTLHQRGFVIRQADGYVPGTMLVRVAERVQPELRALGRGIMARLSAEVRETVVMSIRDGDDAVVLEQVISESHLVRVQHTIGSRHPLTSGASGRALLAYVDETSQRRIIQASGSREAVTRQLESVHQLGYALSHDELQEGVHGIAAPILDSSGHALASMAVLMPTSRAAELMRYIPALLDASRELSAILRHDVAEVAP
jgi:DNA-binding IclR family transcriptional regulator